MLDAALALAEMGYPVFPCQPGGKAPATTHGCLDATLDPAQIEAWWTAEPTANIGVSTAGLLIVDIDGASNPWPGHASQGESLIGAPVSLTPGGGRHLWYRAPRPLRNTAGVLGARVDTRADGGYVVVPPSRRPEGVYSWAPSCDLVARDDLPMAPAWVVEALEEHARTRVTQDPGDGNPIPSGVRNEALTRLGGYLRRAGITRAEIHACLDRINLDRCDPPLDAWEVERIAASVARYTPDQVEVAILERHFDQDWSEPDRRPESPGPFPENLLDVPGLVGLVVEQAARTAIKPQPVLALGAGIALQAALAGRRVQDERGNRTCLYVIGLAPSGAGKENARKVVREALYHAGLSEVEGPEDLASEAGLLSHLARRPATLLQLDEFGRFLQTLTDRRAGSHLKGVITALLRLYSAADSLYLGKAYADPARNTALDQPCVVLHATTTPGPLFSALTVENVEDGFLPRCLVLPGENDPPRQRVRRAKPPEALVEAVRFWADPPAGGNLADQHPDPAVIPADPAAGRVFDALAAEVDATSRGADAPTRALWARSEEKACRLALVYACSRDPRAPRIDEAAASWATAVSLYLTRWLVHQTGLWVVMGAYDARRKRVLRHLEEAGGSIARNQLVRKMQDLPRRDREEVILDLIASKRVVERTETTGGRPRLVLVLEELAMVGEDGA